MQSAPPCQAGCPSGEDIRGYLAIARGIEKPPAGCSWQEYAFRRLTDANPFPAVMGRVCPAPCEAGCNRNEVEDFVGINAVEQFIGDHAIEQGFRFAGPETRSGKKVAVIGGGPAGLSCAYQLARKGHAVTVFDERAELGGMMRYGIPGFRVPREVLDAEIRRILELGVRAQVNCRIGTDVTVSELEDEFDAVFMGLGAQGGRPLPVPGAEAPNVVSAMAFLRAFNDGRLTHVGKRVVVVGGGDTSIDVATVARRLGHIDRITEADLPERVIHGGQLGRDVAQVSARHGAEVTLTSVFSIGKMQANRQEIEHALAEGIAIRDGWAPVEVVCGHDGRATALRIARCEAKFVGPKLEIKLEAGTEQDVPADLIVSAIGQAVDFSGLEAFDSGMSSIAVDRNYQVAGRARYFAGGDVIRPNLLTTAIGHGAIAAEGIDRYLKGEPLEKRPKVDVHHFDLLRKMVERGLETERALEPLRGTSDSKVAVHNFDNRSERHVITHKELYLGHFPHTPRKRRAVQTLSKEQALGNFGERMKGLDESEVVAEAKRCMSCGMCFECDNCVVYCPQRAVYRVPKKEATLGRYVATDYAKCIGCHICRDVCPTGYIQMGLGD
ncbi:MAG: glutamate synthase [Betaproteobacteria bacterium RIFCSPLOWO2_12_FULL_62_13]|nr:MAG: glutamate synthase [Betaproteobacteria bacterium RIFCSPLOWO2_12_FULL_62_13]